MFEKIFKSLRLTAGVIIAVLTVLALSTIYAITPSLPDFIAIFLIVIIWDIFIYIIASRISHKITKSIVSPLTDYENFENTYDEIKPLMHKISSQSNEIKRQTDKAKSRKLQLKSVTSSINEGLIILDENGTVVSINKCAQNFLNLIETDVKRKPFTSVVADDEFIKHIKAAFSGENTHFVYTNNSKAYQTYVSPVIENNIVCGQVILLVDVSERHKTEQIRREFSANVSHELKTPLTTIFGYSQIITNGIAKPDDVKGFAEKIEKESSRLITLIDDIIALSNLEEKGVDAEKEKVSLKQTASEVIESLTEKAKLKNITFSISENDFLIFANHRQIYELLFNLCDNAIKYNKNNGSVSIEISDKKIIVSDTGIGIPEDSLDRIFERFYRVDKSHSKKVNGTGLGLSIVKHIVQSNNAEITVKSKLNEGSSFTILFK